MADPQEGMTTPDAACSLDSRILELNGNKVGAAELERASTEGVLILHYTKGSVWEPRDVAQFFSERVIAIIDNEVPRYLANDAARYFAEQNIPIFHKPETAYKRAAELLK